MNIFVLDQDPTRAAHAQCDKHVIRMLVESCQLLASAYWVELGVRSRKAVLANPNAASIVSELWEGFPRKVDQDKYDGTPLQGLQHEPYWATHTNHPCAIWVRESVANFNWLVDHAIGLAEAYTLRYNKTNACESVAHWFKENPPKSATTDGLSRMLFSSYCEQQGLQYEPIFASEGLTPFAQSIPEEYRGDNAVEAHRLSYMETKARFAVWRYTDAPAWWNPAVNAFV